MEFTTLIREINNTRTEIKNNIISMMRKYNVEEIECTECDDCPIVFSGTGDECMTLDRITLHPNENLIFECSGSWDNSNVTIREIDIEILIENYMWLVENEEFLFANDNEE